MITLIAVVSLGSILVATKPAEFYLQQAYKREVIELFQASFDKEMETESRKVLDTLSRIRMDGRIVVALEKKKADLKSLEKLIINFRDNALRIQHLILAKPDGEVIIKDKKLPKSLMGLAIFKEALKGIHSDNTIIHNKNLYQVYSVPVLSKDHKKVVGVLVGFNMINDALLNDFLKGMGYGDAKKRDVELVIYSDNKVLYQLKKSTLWNEIPKIYTKLSKDIRDSEYGYAKDSLKFGSEEYALILSMVKGSASNPLLEPSKKIPALKDMGIYYVVAWRLPLKLGSFAFMDKVIPQSQLLKGFPMGAFIAASLIFILLGLMIIIWEGDMPMRRMLRQFKEFLMVSINLLMIQALAENLAPLQEK